jgi:L-threonylcarbamoyladenylate synthase
MPPKLVHWRLGLQAVSATRTRSVKTRVLRVDSSHPDPLVIDEAARVLKGGGLVAFPTETVYGLGARALDDAAVARIFAAKGRPTDHPIIAHVTGESQATSLAAHWSDRVSRLTRTFWPGPLTVIVPRAAHVPPRIGGGGDSIAIRAPAHPVARSLIEALGEPIAAPSANPYQALSPTRAAHVLSGLDGKIDLLLDGGPSEGGIESTVVDVRGDEIVILRPGSIGRDALARVEMRVRHWGGTETAAAHASPGMDRRHYAPRTPLHLVTSREAALATARLRAERGERVGVLLRGALGSASAEAFRGDERVGLKILPDSPSEYAHALYATLHEIDDFSLDVILVEAVPEDDAWRAVADRLRRASVS